MKEERIKKNKTEVLKNGTESVGQKAEEYR